MSKEQNECLRTLKCLGYKWNTETPVGHNLELHNIITINRKQHLLFVAELDAYGNVEFGMYDESRKMDAKFEAGMFNADGDIL